MADIFNKKTGKWESVADDQAGAALQQSDTYGIPAGGTVQVQNPDSGEIISVTTEELPQLYDMGFKTPTRSDTAASEQEQLHQQITESFNSPIDAFTTGMTRGLLPGADAIIDAVGGPEATAAAQMYEQVNPKSTLAGQVVGNIATSMATGGLGTQAAAKSAVAASRLGKAAEAAKDGTQLLEAGAAATQAANALRQSRALGLVETVAQGAAEGAVWGAGSGLSDAIINNKEDVAEKMLMGGLEGGVLGGALGGILEGVVTPAARVAKQKTGEVLDATLASASKIYGKVVDKVAKNPEAGAAFKELMNDPDFVRNIAGMKPDELKEATKKAVKYFEENDAMVGGYAKKIKEDLKSFTAEEKNAFKAAMNEAQGDIPAAFDAIKLRKDQAYDFAAGAARALEDQPASFMPKIVDKVEETIRVLQKGSSESKKLAKELDRVLNNNLPDKKIRILRGADKQAAIDASFNGYSELMAAKELNEVAGKFAQHAKSNTFINGAEKHALNEAHNFIQDIAYNSHPDEAVRGAFQNADKMNQVYQTVRRTLYDDVGVKPVEKIMNPANMRELNKVMSSIEDIAPILKKIGGDFDNLQKNKELLAEWNALAKDKQLDPEVMATFAQAIGKDAKNIRDVGRIRELKVEMDANPSMTPIDKYIRAKKMFGGDLTEETLALQKNQAKLDLLRKVSEGSVDTGHVGLRDVAIASVFGPKIAGGTKLIGMARNNPQKSLELVSGILNTYDKSAKLISRAVDGAIDTMKSRTARAAYVANDTRKDRRETVDRVIERLIASNDPDDVARVLSESTAQYADMPEVQMAVSNQIAKSAEFLKSKIPPAYGMKSPFAAKAPEIPSYEIDKFYNYYKGVTDPERTIRRIGAGSVTPQEIEALKTVNANTFADLQTQFVDGIMAKGGDIPYSRRLALSQMFDLTTEPTLQGNFISSMQANFATPEKPGGQGRPQGSPDSKPRFKRNLDDMYATDLQRTLMKDQ